MHSFVFVVSKSIPEVPPSTNRNLSPDKRCNQGYKARILIALGHARAHNDILLLCARTVTVSSARTVLLLLQRASALALFMENKVMQSKSLGIWIRKTENRKHKPGEERNYRKYLLTNHFISRAYLYEIMQNV